MICHNTDIGTADDERDCILSEEYASDEDYNTKDDAIIIVVRFKNNKTKKTSDTKLKIIPHKPITRFLMGFKQIALRKDLMTTTDNYDKVTFLFDGVVLNKNRDKTCEQLEIEDGDMIDAEFNGEFKNGITF